MTELFLAIDGGQSGTVAVLGDATGAILGVGRGGPIRHHEEAEAESFVRDGLGTAIADAVTGFENHPIAVSCLALTGSAGFARSLVAGLGTVDRIIALESDTYAALASGTRGAGGVGVIAGTGTVALARGRRGPDVVKAGWGWALGDEGSGFWIAMEALKAAARALDGTGEPTALTPALPQALGERDMRGVYNLVTGRRFDRTRIAALTTDVVDLAEAGDSVAARILDVAADHLTALVVATASAASFLEEDERIVVASGGVLRAGGWVTRRLETNLATRLPGFGFTTPAVPPVIGAYYLGLVGAGITVDEGLHSRVAQQLQSHPHLVSKTGSPVA